MSDRARGRYRTRVGLPEHMAPPTMPDEGVSLGEVQRTLARIELRMDRVVDDHESRLRRVERWVYAIPPALIISAAAVITAVVRGGP